MRIWREQTAPRTAHTTNPVPVWVEGSGHQEVKDGILADVAPTVLALMGVSQLKK